MAVLDENATDEETGRPLKVLVCKQHVPQMKSSLGTDSLEMKHKTSAPKTSMQGLHRALMRDFAKTEDRGESKAEGNSSRPPGSGSGHSKVSFAASDPRQIDAPSADSLTFDPLPRQSYVLSLDGIGDDSGDMGYIESATIEDTGDKAAEMKLEEETLEKEPVLKPSDEKQEEEDDSFRTLPVSHNDYEAQAPATKPHHLPQHDDEKQERDFCMKSTTVEDAPEGGEDGVEESKAHKDEPPKQADLTVGKVLAMPELLRQARVHGDSEEAQGGEEEWSVSEDKAFQPTSIAVK
ncbi:hypothetical protein DFQ26_004659 [Actinomortierella ambigua]|nr:hypothetical protein DFQ26_004659 [Actinomortierella ambigua]